MVAIACEQIRISSEQKILSMKGLPGGICSQPLHNLDRQMLLLLCTHLQTTSHLLPAFPCLCLLLCTRLQLTAVASHEWTYDSLGDGSAQITYFLMGYMNAFLTMIGEWLSISDASLSLNTQSRAAAHLACLGQSCVQGAALRPTLFSLISLRCML